MRSMHFNMCPKLLDMVLNVWFYQVFYQFLFVIFFFLHSAHFDVNVCWTSIQGHAQTCPRHASTTVPPREVISQRLLLSSRCEGNVYTMLIIIYNMLYLSVIHFFLQSVSTLHIYNHMYDIFIDCRYLQLKDILNNVTYLLCTTNIFSYRVHL